MKEQAEDKLSKVEIEKDLGKEREIIVLDETDSTNSELKRIADKGAKSGTVVIANSQYAGRGRLGRSFYSPEDNGIYMSYLLRPTIETDDVVLITTAVSVAVCRAIERTTGKRPLIKWVNDLYLKNKKICGILTEGVRNYQTGEIEYIIIGIGINCKGSVFPEEISDIAGNMLDETENVKRNRIVAEIIKEIDGLEDTVTQKTFINEYKERSLVLGKRIKIMGDCIKEAIAVDIDKSGGLVVKLDNGEITTLSSGEISIRLTGDTNWANNKKRRCEK